MAKHCFAATGVITDYRPSAESGTGVLYERPEEAAREIALLLSDIGLRRALQSNCLKRAKTFPTWAEVFDTQLFSPIGEVVKHYRKRNTPSGIIRQRFRRAR
jgi:hypothetical protein